MSILIYRTGSTSQLLIYNSRILLSFHQQPGSETFHGSSLSSSGQGRKLFNSRDRRVRHETENNHIVQHRRLSTFSGLKSKPSIPPRSVILASRLLSSSTRRSPPRTDKFSSSTSPHDLRSFLDHAFRTNISQTSTTFFGTRYEYLIKRHLENQPSPASATTSASDIGSGTGSLGKFELSRIGGRGDKGIDLVGIWHLPTPPSANSLPATPPTSKPTATRQSSAQSDLEGQKVKVLVQCKRLGLPPSAPPSPFSSSAARKSSDSEDINRNKASKWAGARTKRSSTPQMIRELEGAFHSVPKYFNARSSTSSSSISRSESTTTKESVPTLVVSEAGSETRRNSQDLRDEGDKQLLSIPSLDSESGSESDSDSGEVTRRGHNKSQENNNNHPAITVGILVTTSPATEGVRQAMQMSRRCLMYLCVEEEDEEMSSLISRISSATTAATITTTNTSKNDGESAVGKEEVDQGGRFGYEERQPQRQPQLRTRMVQILWNKAMSDACLAGFDVGTRYVSSTPTTLDHDDHDHSNINDGQGTGETDVKQEAILLWQGQPY